MIVFEVVARKTADIVGHAGMLSKGYRIILDPDRHEKHADLAMKLRKNVSWQEVNEPTQAAEPKTTVATPSDDLLPHQRETLARLRASNMR